MPYVEPGPTEDSTPKTRDEEVGEGCMEESSRAGGTRALGWAACLK